MHNLSAFRLKHLTVRILAVFFILSFLAFSASAEYEGKVRILLLGDSTTEGSIPRLIKPDGPHLAHETAKYLPTMMRARDPKPPEGFRAIFNGKNLDGWYGLNPHNVAKLVGEEKEANLKAQRAEFSKNWTAENGELVNDGHGP
ncbi:MAG TPA: hypothetical protein PK992_18755, partial [Planctomycetaceae bacterium]|nr:hypothetical protein [Planctomycetaceae bacterium]